MAECICPKCGKPCTWFNYKNIWIKGKIDHREHTICPSVIRTKGGEAMLEMCESCNEKLATGHCKNPDYAGYNLCDECAQEYDSRPHGIVEAGKS